MDSGMVISVGALVVSVCAAVFAWDQARSARRQADTAAQTATDARRSAAAAEAQVAAANSELALMHAQWEAAQAAAEEQAKPKVRLEVEHRNVGSFITLVNQGEDIVHIASVVLGGQELPYQQMRWNAVDLPKLSTVPPSGRTMLVFGIGNVMFNGTLLKSFEDWEEFKVTFTHGLKNETWVLHCEVRLPEGQFAMRNLQLRPE